MNNHQIDFVLNKYNVSKAYKGSYAIDNVQPVTSNSVVIYNTEPAANSKKKIGHWTAVFTSNQIQSEIPSCIYFDPLGEILHNQELAKQLLNFSSTITYSNIQYQSIFSELCSLHVIFVTKLYCEGVSVHDILTKYYNSDSNKEFTNDRIVYYALLSDLKKLPGGGEKLSSRFTLQLPFFPKLENHGF